MLDGGELTVVMRGTLKDLIVDQDPSILAVAEHFDEYGDLIDVRFFPHPPGVVRMV